MKKTVLLFLWVLLSSGLSGQVIRKIEPENPAIESYYVVEPRGEIKGAMVLLPPGFSPVEGIFPETKLHNVAYLHNILVVALAYGGNTIYMTDEVLFRMNTVLAEVVETYGIPPDKFVIGGFSAGGITSLCYAVHAKKFPGQTAVDPAGVFTADSPVDIAEVWRTLNRELEKNYSAMAMAEARNFLPEIERDMNGTPEENPESYVEHSPFSLQRKDGGNAKYLLSTAVRLHHDPDILWQIKNRRRDYYDMNEPMASALVNWLLLHGYERAEFVVADRPAHRSQGNRHPHSWSVIEEVACVLWAKRCLDIE